MKNFRPSGIRTGLKFLLNSIHCSYDDMERELKDYRVKTEREEKTRWEKRRKNLEIIRNRELVLYVFIIMIEKFVTICFICFIKQKLLFFHLVKLITLNFF